MSAGATPHKWKALQMSIFCQVRPMAQFHDGINSNTRQGRLIQIVCYKEADGWFPQLISRIRGAV